MLKTVESYAQIGFWIVGGGVAVATYLQARKTIFQPLRTEIFKRQLDEMSGVLKLFVGKGEIALRSDFDYDLAMAANTQRMYDSYAGHAFRVSFSKERLYSRTNCPSSLVDPEALELVDGHLREDPKARKGSADLAGVWEYRHLETHIPRKWDQQVDDIRGLLQNPLLPTAMANLLEEYLEINQRNLSSFRAILADCATEMPAKYPTMDDLKSGQSAWIHNRMLNGLHSLEPAAANIIKFARSYFSSDQLLNSRRTNPLRRIYLAAVGRAKSGKSGASGLAP